MMPTCFGLVTRNRWRKFKKAVFQGVNPENGSPTARIGVALDELRREADQLKMLNTEEGESYQWQVIGSLVSVIAAMLEIAESK
jgi:hypothetical protein